MSIRVSQFVNEVWVTNPSRIRVTQVGNEVWIIPSGGKVRVSQIGIEVWRTVAGLPLTITGYADGQANVYAISSNSQLAEGHADGYATAWEAKDARPAPIMVVMGI